MWVLNECGVVGQVLHAKTLGFNHPTTGKYIEFKQEEPEEFKEMVVLAYLNGEGSYLDLMIKYNIPANATNENWVKDYNSHIELKDYIC